MEIHLAQIKQDIKNLLKQHDSITILFKEVNNEIIFDGHIKAPLQGVYSYEEMLEHNAFRIEIDLNGNYHLFGCEPSRSLTELEMKELYWLTASAYKETYKND